MHMKNQLYMHMNNFDVKSFSGCCRHDLEIKLACVRARITKKKFDQKKIFLTKKNFSPKNPKKCFDQKIFLTEKNYFNKRNFLTDPGLVY